VVRRDDGRPAQDARGTRRIDRGVRSTNPGDSSRTAAAAATRSAAACDRRDLGVGRRAADARAGGPVGRVRASHAGTARGGIVSRPQSPLPAVANLPSTATPANVSYPPARWGAA